MNALFVPLSLLPGPVPAGAPLRATCPKCRGSGMVPHAAQNLRGEVVAGPCTVCPSTTFFLYSAHGEALHASALVAGTVFSDPFGALGLDLSAPTLTDGWPDRIDGAHVAASMLARAMGWPTDAMGIAVAVKTARDLAGRMGADIDPADPNADRLALCAIIRAQPWKVPNG